MKLADEIHAMLQALQRLYSRVTLQLLHRRTGSYRRQGHTGAESDIVTPLSEQIDRLAVARNGTSGKAANAAARTAPPAVAATPRSPRSVSRRPVVGRVVDGISRYFRSRQHGSAAQPHVREKLQKSTLEHIHTSLRLARQGEVYAARLHADIAGNALKELAHYMSGEEYVQFRAEVEEKLRAVRERMR